MIIKGDLPSNLSELPTSNGTPNVTITVDDLPMETPTIVEPEYSCQTCGKALVYGGRGRKPRYCDEHKRGGNTTKIGARNAAGSDVIRAVAALEMAYGLMRTGFMMIGAVNAASDLGRAIPQLSASNMEYLSQDKELTRAINKMGKVSGRSGFILTHILTLGPIAIGGTLEAREMIAQMRGDNGDENVTDNAA
jgi:hypothetical protein